MNKEDLSRRIKQKAQDLGFISCGISRAEFLEEEAKHLETWLKSGFHGKMNYMENHFDKRLNPTLLVDDAKSVISVLLNYYPEQDLFKHRDLKISKYAYGQDYHYVIRNRLDQLKEFIFDLCGERSARVFTDSAPVLDKAWAERSGLGWIGKNANLLSKQVGSFFFIGEIIIDLDLEYDQPTLDHCGSCTACIDACPTGAIINAKQVDGSKCISYLTIELKDELLPKDFQDKMEGWVFGCDICQDVCPWNRFSRPTSVDEFKATTEFKEIDLTELTESAFQLIFSTSAIKRTKYTGLSRNIQFVQQKKGAT